jgi:uncharacterized protein YndB with AHSA1/START domain
MEKQPLVMERTYNAPVDKVWRAITDVGQMRQWYFNLDDFKPEVGFTFEFSGQSDCGDYLHFCEVTEVVDGRKITYSWSYKDYEGMSYLSWELFPEGEMTRLVLTHTGLETFPPMKDFTRESFSGGWTYFVHDALKKFLEG